MCLAVPGRIIAVEGPPGAGRTGTVDFQGSRMEVGLALVPEAAAGDWVLVHAGFAISLLDEAEALETWRYLAEAGLAADIPGDPEEASGI